MKITRLVLSAAALAALLVAPVASACEGHAKAAKASTKDGEKMSCASHAKGKDGKACCTEHAKGTKTASKAACAVKGEAAAVAMAGKVLCEHCDLKKAESCRTVFQADGKTDYMPICPMSDVAALKKAGEHGGKVLDLQASVCEDKKGEKMLMVSSFTVRS